MFDEPDHAYDSTRKSMTVDQQVDLFCRLAPMIRRNIAITEPDADPFEAFSRAVEKFQRHVETAAERIGE